MVMGDTTYGRSIYIISLDIYIKHMNEPQIESLNDVEELVAEEAMRNKALAEEVMQELTDDDSDEKVDNGNYPQDMDKTLI